jgi:hypothetical protein
MSGGIFATDLASIGFTGGITGRSMLRLYESSMVSARYVIRPSESGVPAVLPLFRDRTVRGV